jgi:hypothetical protein
MSFRKDFHGGRGYAPDPSNKGRPGLVGWVKLQLSRLTPDAPTFLPEGLSRRKSEGFSLLESNERQSRCAS